jgi:hypothetical protein
MRFERGVTSWLRSKSKWRSVTNDDDGAHTAVCMYTRALEVDPLHFKSLFNRGFSMMKTER